MSSIKPRIQGSKRTWVARWRDQSGRQRSKSFAKKVHAEQHIVRIEADRLRGVYIDPRAGKISLQEYAETRWLPAQVHLRPSTRALYKAHLHNHLLPALGHRSLISIRKPDAKAIVALLDTTLAPSTVGTAFAVLRMVMASAVDDELIPANPCSKVSLPEVEQQVLEPLDPNAVLALADAITPRYKVTVWLAAGAGLREGEALGLLTPRVDFLRRRLRVEQQLQGSDHGVPNLVPPKTKKSRRTVPLDDRPLQAITEHLQRWPAAEYQLLVTNRCGRPVQRSSFGHCWREAVERAGLPTGTRYHDLRHFYASTLIAANVNPKVIQSRLGHATIGETMDTYGHLFPDSEDAGRGAVDAMLSDSDVRYVCDIQTEAK